MTVRNIGKMNGQVFMPSTGESAILVIPISFTDREFTSTELERIENSFFGTSDETYWESVSSYYEKSSYGNLHITGEVVDPISCGYTVEEAFDMYDRNSSFVQSLLYSALRELDDQGFDFSRFDLDEDGFLDAVWLVNSAFYFSGFNFLWAFTSWTTSWTLSVGGGYHVSSYSWASVDFLRRYAAIDPSTSIDLKNSNSTTDGDAHTFIHETGHLMGLDDYYSYVGEDAPMGGLCMMDYNIGDQDAFSKFALGWIDPKVITKEELEESNYQITLDRFTASGDAIIIPIYRSGKMDYNNTPLDEYLIVEYYTPDGLNAMDATTPYETVSMFDEPGILVYHVNARIGGFTSFGYSVIWDDYCYDAIPTYSASQTKTFYYLYSNTREYSYDTSITKDAETYYKGRLVSLMGADERKTYFTTTDLANNDSLFQEDDVFALPGGAYDDFLFDSENAPAFGFVVSEMNEESCTLLFDLTGFGGVGF